MTKGSGNDRECVGMTVGAEITIWRYGKKTRWLGKGMILKFITNEALKWIIMKYYDKMNLASKGDK